MLTYKVNVLVKLCLKKTRVCHKHLSLKKFANRISVNINRFAKKIIRPNKSLLKFVGRCRKMFPSEIFPAKSQQNRKTFVIFQDSEYDLALKTCCYITLFDRKTSLFSSHLIMSLVNKALHSLNFVSFVVSHLLRLVANSANNPKVIHLKHQFDCMERK